MAASQEQHASWSYKLLSTIGVLLHLLFVDIPKDVIRWLSLREKSVNGQVVVVTGGASGLGRRMAYVLAVEKKALVAVLDVDEGAGEECVAEIRKAGGEAHFWLADITDSGRLAQVALHIQSTMGQVDIVVCNAAVLYFGFFMELTGQQIQKAVDVNIVGTINTIRAFLGGMEERRKGHIVAVSSIAGFAGETFGLAYCPTKFAVRGVMECLQMELRDRGFQNIHCTTLCPYFSRTPMILNMGMRPTSTWIPFMSVNSCAHRMVKAILKENVVAFMPSYVTCVALGNTLSSLHVQSSLREYLNCRYEPPSNQNSSRQLLKMTDTFRPVHPIWWFIIPPALAVNFLAWYSPEFLRHTLPVIGPFAAELAQNTPQVVAGTNIFALVVHAIEGLFGLAWSVQAGNSFATSAKWFFQTFIFGFPSLRLVKALRDKQTKKSKRN